MSSVIGITFGNTSSSIAVAKQDGKVDVIANPDGDRSIPSVLSYVGTDEYHGAQAAAQLVRNPKNTIINFRDFLGKKFADIDASVANAGATPVETPDGGIGYNIVRDEGRTELVTVEEATTRHFKQLKSAAEDYLGSKVEKAVLALPTDFSEHQKKELEKAVGAAGIRVIQTINEPSAALLAHLTAYSTEDHDCLQDDKIYVVADFGGIRSDVAVVAVRGGILTILATAHEKFGGDQLDGAISEYFSKEFEKKFKVDPRQNARSLAKLKAEAIVAKKTLSNVQSLSFSIESLAEGFDFISNINRLRFELAARKPLSDMTALADKALAKAGLEALDVDTLLLVGGCANVVKLAQNFEYVFPESCKIVAPSVDPRATNPEELSTKGAALKAALVESFDEGEIKESLSPVIINTQHLQKPIGFKDAEGNFHTILAAETSLPIKRAVEVTNGSSPDVGFELYEGQRTIKETVVEAQPDSDPDSDDSEDDEPEIKREVVYKPGDLLAKLAMTGLGPNSKIEVLLNITQNGTLHLAGREMKRGSTVVKGEISK